MVKVIQYKVLFQGRTYVPGENITGLSKEEEARLVGKGYCAYPDAGAAPEEQKKKPGYGISGMNVKEASKVVESVETMEQLQLLLEEEKAGKNRSTLMDLIAVRIEEMEDTKDNEPKGNTDGTEDTNDTDETDGTDENPEDIHVGFNANDVVVD